jgi:hypothetical protein
MSRADYFRANATECEKKAEATKDVQVQEFFREAATEWRKLADQIGLERYPLSADVPEGSKIRRAKRRQAQGHSQVRKRAWLEHAHPRIANENSLRDHHCGRHGTSSALGVEEGK